jgi:hypothetical protein
LKFLEQIFEKCLGAWSFWGDKMAKTIKLPPPVADIYRAVGELETAYPGCKFTPDGHLVGSIGEVIAQ